MARPQKNSPVRGKRSSSHTRWLAKLLEPVDAAGLAFFRIAFYSIMVWEAWRFLDNRWIERYFSGKDFYFKFWPFDFVAPWPGEGMRIQAYVMAFFALCAAFGLFYRVSAALFCLMMTHFFLIEQARFLNHLYLVCLISFLMILVPAHRAFSLDARRKKFSGQAPAWAYWLLRFQVGVPYFFGGIAKLNHDWFRGEPLREWLADRTDFPFLGQFFENEPVVWTMVYGSLMLDLFVVFLLVRRRTRILGFLATLIFHLMNSRLFGIGIFPWTMIAATAIFFDPDWPRRFMADLKRGHPLRGPCSSAGFVLGFFTAALLPKAFALPRALIGGLGLMVAGYHLDEPWRRGHEEQTKEPSSTNSWQDFSPRQRAFALFLFLWIVVQIVLPLRHMVIPGNVHWTEEGHLYAWHMKLRDKDGAGLFTVVDPSTGDTWQIRPGQILTRFQERKMLTRPIMIVQFARYLEKRIRDQEKGRGDLEVRAEIRVSLNGRRPQKLIDPEVDLTQVPYPWFGHSDFIVPLTVPLE